MNIQVADLTIKTKEWILHKEEYKALTLVTNIVHGLVSSKYAVYKIYGEESICVMMTSDPARAVRRYNAIEQIEILSKLVEVSEEV